MSEKEPKFLNSHDSALRIHNCYVKYKGRVYYSVDQGGGGLGSPIVRLSDPVSRAFVVTIDANDPELDTGHIPLGWFNVSTSEAVYAMRAPYRKQKSAVSPENSFCFSPIKDFEPSSCYDIGDYGDSVGFRDMLEDRYLPVPDSIKKFNGLGKTHGYVSTPLSKELCLVKIGASSRQLYKGVYSIGNFNGELVTLDDKYDNSLNRMMLASVHLI